MPSIQERFDRVSEVLRKLGLHLSDIAAEAGYSSSHIKHTISGHYAPSLSLVLTLEEVVERVVKRMVAIVLAARPHFNVLGFDLTSARSPSVAGLRKAEEALTTHLVESLLGKNARAGRPNLPAGARGAIARIGGGLYLIYVSEDAGPDTGRIFDHEVAELRGHVVRDDDNDPPTKIDVAY